MQVKNKPKTEYSMVRVKREVIEIIRLRASRQNRSMANYIETLVLTDVERSKE